MSTLLLIDYHKSWPKTVSIYTTVEVSSFVFTPLWITGEKNSNSFSIQNVTFEFCDFLSLSPSSKRKEKHDLQKSSNWKWDWNHYEARKDSGFNNDINHHKAFVGLALRGYIAYINCDKSSNSVQMIFPTYSNLRLLTNVMLIILPMWNACPYCNWF